MLETILNVIISGQILIPILIVGIIIGFVIKNKELCRLCATALCIIIALAAIMYTSLLYADPFMLLFGEVGSFFPALITLMVFGIAMLLIWQLFSNKIRRITVFSLSFCIVLLISSTIGNSIYQKRLTIDTNEGEMELSDYAPFKEETLVASLNEASTLQLAEDLPVLDGATALYPLYSAFARATYPPGNYPFYSIEEESGEVAEHEHLSVLCSSTDYAFDNLLKGKVDIAFLMGVSEKQRAAARAQGLELTLTPIGREAFVFFVNKANKTDNITSADIKKIYSGKITNWRQVGGSNHEIRAYQRREGSGSQTRLLELMGNIPILPAPEEDIYQSMMGMYRVVASYKNHRNSLGYSFLYYIRDMIGENKIKFLTIDGIAPTPENIANGSYPFINNIYAVTVKNRDNISQKSQNIAKFLDWIQGEQGKTLVEKTGYVAME